RAADEASVEPLEKYGTPPLVPPVSPRKDEAVIDELQTNPVSVVHCNASAAVSQDGMAKAAGEAAPLVEFATTVFVAIVARLVIAGCAQTGTPDDAVIHSFALQNVTAKYGSGCPELLISPKLCQTPSRSTRSL
ncbi:MAG: hypothetical protein WC069_07325, partial [Candidatus Shapirobacteria bacterium]